MIARLLAPLSSGLPGAYGLADDAACLAPPDGSAFVVTLDTLIAGRHFHFDGSAGDARHAARKALAVNVSDLAAKAADPFAYFLSLELPAGHEAWLDAFVDGLAQSQRDFGLQLAGGDTVASPDRFSLSITALGIVPVGGMLRRSTARAGDVLCVSGTIGDAWAGLMLSLEDPRAARWAGVLAAADRTFFELRNRTPSPRTMLLPALRAHASAALDVSDGLAIDAGRLAAASGLKAVIDADRVPLSAPAAKLQASGAASVSDYVTGGDDYEILAAVPAAEAGAFVDLAAAHGLPVTPIGQLVDGDGVELRDAEGKVIALQRLGWDHFA